jgi:hypothetical protein
LCAQFEYKDCRDPSQQHHAETGLPLDPRSGCLCSEEQHHPGTSPDAISNSGLGSVSREHFPDCCAVLRMAQEESLRAFTCKPPSAALYQLLCPSQSSKSLCCLCRSSELFEQNNGTPCTELRTPDSTNSKGVRSGFHWCHCLEADCLEADCWVADCWAPAALVAGW